MRALTLADVANILNHSIPTDHSPVLGYCVDSRILNPGELFFALIGDRTDGHDYLHEVCKKGALGAVVSKDYQSVIEGLPLIRVNDPLQALQAIAKAMLMRSSSRIVAITGSIGKTTTKEFTKSLLASKYHVAASPGNCNSQIGIPLSILNHTTGQEDILVLEMGMTKPGHLASLVHIVPPEVAVITKVALVHAENFESIEEIARTKAEIFTHPLTRMRILDRECPIFSEIGEEKISFSTLSLDADYFLNDERIIHARLENRLQKLEVFHLPGLHNLHNLLASIAVARYFEMSWEEIITAIPSLVLPKKRLQMIKRKEATFIDDSYNASELSIKAALEALPEPEKGGKKIAVLGSMLELGKFSHECHHRVGEYALKHVEEIYCIGEECRPIYESWKKVGRPVSLFDNRSDLVANLRHSLHSNDIVLLKGSRAKELWKILDEL